MNRFSTDAVACVEIGYVFEDVGEELGIGVNGETVDGRAEIGCATLFHH